MQTHVRQYRRRTTLCEHGVAMDFLIELLVQFIVEVVGEVIFEAIWHGLAHAYRTRIGRYALTAVVGVCFGIWWGWHLSAEPDPPKLLWVSSGLGLVALLFARRHAVNDVVSASPAGHPAWRQALEPPNRWPASRWMNFVILNASIAIGIVGGYVLG